MEHEKSLLQVKAELEGLESAETEVQTTLLDLRHELEQYSSAFKDSQHKIKYYQNEVSALLASHANPDNAQSEIVRQHFEEALGK